MHPEWPITPVQKRLVTTLFIFVVIQVEWEAVMTSFIWSLFYPISFVWSPFLFDQFYLISLFIRSILFNPFFYPINSIWSPFFLFDQFYLIPIFLSGQFHLISYFIPFIRSILFDFFISFIWSILYDLVFISIIRLVLSDLAFKFASCQFHYSL